MNFASGLGLSLAAGFNAWATLIVFGGLERLFPDLLPGKLSSFLASGPVLTVAVILFAAEFFADKVPRLDRFWNLIHTFLRPAVGAALAVASIPNGSLAGKIGAALAGVLITLAAHVAKATSRFTSTAAISGLSQLVASIAEDVVAICITAVAIFTPAVSIAVIIAVAVLLIILYGRVRAALAILFFLAKHPRAVLGKIQEDNQNIHSA